MLLSVVLLLSMLLLLLLPTATAVSRLLRPTPSPVVMDPRRRCKLQRLRPLRCRQIPPHCRNRLVNLPRVLVIHVSTCVLGLAVCAEREKTQHSPSLVQLTSGLA